MKRLLVLALAAVLLAAFTAPALAFEFSLKGTYQQRVSYFSRTGDKDLFGLAPLQDVNGANPVGFAGPNRWRSAFSAAPANAIDVDGLTQRIVRGGFSMWQCDALMEEMRVELIPTFRVNKAIRVYGHYNIGGIRNRYAPVVAGVGTNGAPPFEKWAMMRASRNGDDTAMLGSWDQLRATIQLPWGVISIGNKNFPLGTGATFSHDAKGDSFLFVIPYGPFRFLPTVWVARSILYEANGNANSTTPDHQDKWDIFGGCLFTYSNGPVQIGGGVVLQAYDLDPGDFRSVLGITPGHQDREILVRAGFMKYNNGRFFANLEYAHMMDNQHNIGALPAYIESWHFFSEAGVVVGPMKIGLVYAVANGPVLNMGGNATTAYAAWAINNQALEPYEFLMFNTYAGGNNQFNGAFIVNDEGNMGDAYCYAARIDYACASNLNVYLSYIWAHRLEVAGFRRGGILSTGANATVVQATAWKNTYWGAGGSPYVGDGFLGYEWNLGVDWKLLEGLTWKNRYSYWQPGEWFDEAYQAVSRNPAGAIVANGRIVGRDAIHSFQGTLVIDF